MSALIASSKVSGWSETGFAFGITDLQMASAIAHSSLHISSENASAAAFSASCYHVRKHIWILAIVVAVREFGQIQRQIGFRHIVKRAHDATFQQAPEAIQVRGVDVPRTYSPL